MNSLNAILIASIIAACNFLVIFILKKNDKELSEYINQRVLYRMIISSFIVGMAIGFMPGTIKWIMVIPTVFIFVAAETDMFIKQIYSLPCIIGGASGLGLIFLLKLDFSDYFYRLIFCAIILLIFKLIRALNTGDVELILAVTPYLYILSKNFTRPTFMELFLFYLLGSFIFALIINFKKYHKEKIKSFPFAIPACLCYCSYFLILCILNFMN